MSTPQDFIKQVQARVTRLGGGGSGGNFGRGPGSAVLTLVALGGVGVALQNSLFNVDGGHRAIKYTRAGGVSKEIYAEGASQDPSLLGDGH